MIAQPETSSQECVAADWQALKVEIDQRYSSVRNSLDEMISQVKTDSIPEEAINSQKQIEAIDSLLRCLNSSQFPATLSPRKDQAVELLTDFKNNILNRAQEGLVNNNDGIFDNQDNFYSLKLNLSLTEEQARVLTIGQDFITAFEGAIGIFTTNVSSQINQLPETLPPSPPSESLSPSDPTKVPSDPGGTSLKLEIWQTILLIVGGLSALTFVIFKVRSDRSNHSHRRRLRRNSTILGTLQREVHLPLLSSKGKRHSSDEETIELGESNQTIYLEQKIHKLVEQQIDQQMREVNDSIITLIDQRLTEINLSQRSFPPQPTSTPPTVAHEDKVLQKPAPPLSMSPIEQIIQAYNTNPGNLQGIGVSETQDSFNQRRTSSSAPVFLHQASNPSFYIVQDRYLVPRPGSKVTTHKLNTIDALFDCDNFYQSGAPFQLIEPAIVSPLSNNQWQLNQKGKLKFL
jgi:hypothetical protein